MPPDVWRRLAAPTSARLFPGSAPGSGLALRTLLGQRPYQGHSPNYESYLDGGAEPPPHIRRQSRTWHGSWLWRQSRHMVQIRVRWPGAAGAHANL